MACPFCNSIHDSILNCPAVMQHIAQLPDGPVRDTFLKSMAVLAMLRATFALIRKHKENTA
jgi:hypothetical protein